MDKGLKILKKIYDSTYNWQDYHCTDEEFEIAKQEGYMFDYPEYMSHEDTLKELKTVVDKISPEMVANAFLYSLSTRKLEYRSALGSYWYAASIPDHECECDADRSRYYKYCDYCKWHQWDETPSDHNKYFGLNWMNYLRYTLGGDFFVNLNYALFDLKQFLKLPVYEHTAEDEQILHDILHCIDKLLPKNKARSLQKAITKKRILKSNKNEVDILLNILGICGVLSSESVPCYAVRFVSVWERSPLEHTNDYDYPLNWWRVSDGINTERYNIVFGKNYV